MNRGEADISKSDSKSLIHRGTVAAAPLLTPHEGQGDQHTKSRCTLEGSDTLKACSQLM